MSDDVPDTVPSPPGLGPRSLAGALRDLDAGVCEIPDGMNRGPRVDQYMRPIGLFGVAWCSGAASCWRKEALGEGEVDPLGYHASVAGTWTAAVKAGLSRPKSYQPSQGDLAIFKRGGQDPTHGGEGHVELVELPPDGYGAFTSVGGNVTNAVRRLTHSIHDVELVGWVQVP